MEHQIQKCSNCGSTITAKNQVFPSDAIELINKFGNGIQPSYCVKCGKKGYFNALKRLESEKAELIRRNKVLLHKLPTATIHNPKDWDYEVKGIVSGQSTSGTGVVMEFTSGFADFLGGQSGEYSSKVSNGEAIALFQLKTKAIRMGANAVIAMDYKYAQIGGAKGMILVAAIGTAIKLKNPQVLSSASQADFELLEDLSAQMEILAKYKTYKI